MSASFREYVNDIGEANEEILTWAINTFGAVGTPTLAKVEEEMAELKEAFELAKIAPTSDHLNDLHEAAADVYIAFIVFCYRAGVPLTSSSRAKMGINRMRKWGLAVDGVARHIEVPSDFSCGDPDCTSYHPTD